VSKGAIVIVSGAPGSGKSTVSRALSQDSASARAVHLHTDDFYARIMKGFVAPWLPESQRQNEVVTNAIVASAAQYAEGGFEVIVDGVIGPWFIEPWRALAQRGIEVHYAVLRVQEHDAIERIAKRGQADGLDPEAIRSLCRQFSNLGSFEAHSVDVVAMTPHQVVATLRTRLASGTLRLGATADTA
jgi:chloramphenicol 3-O-phosphotransferase